MEVRKLKILYRVIYFHFFIDGTDVEGAGRGAIAKEDLKIGDIALEVPVSLVISENLVFETGMVHFALLSPIVDVHL